jgi:hypothetical protein
MVLALFLIVLGLAGCVWGVLLATGMRRPMDLLGALLAAAGWPSPCWAPAACFPSAFSRASAAIFPARRKACV